MNLLAIDTSSNACSVAVQRDRGVVEQHVVRPREHTKILLPMIKEALRDADLEIENLDAVVLGNGPGSFIGMRIGVSVAQGICYAADIDMVPVSSLLAIAEETMFEDSTENVVAAQDARMGEVYVGVFERSDAGMTDHVGEEFIVPIGAIDNIVPGSTACGLAWHDIPQLLETNAGSIAALSDVRYPRAKYLLKTAASLVDRGNTISPEALEPAYLRTRVASQSPKQQAAEKSG